MGGFASSRILEVHAERMLNGTFNPGFRIRLHQKDLNLAWGSERFAAQLAQHGDRAANVRLLHGAWRRRARSFGDDPGD